VTRTKETPGVEAYYAALQQVFELHSEILTAALPHMGERGRNDEELFRAFLARTLPRRFSIGTGFLICSDSNLPGSNQQDIVIFDEINNSPLHRELAAFVYPIEMVYATIEVKGRLKHADLQKSLESITTIRQLAKHKRYTMPAGIAVHSQPGKAALAQVEMSDELPPRAYVLAYDVDGWEQLDSFAESWRKALLANPGAHLHGVAVLKRNWFAYQMAYTAPQVSIRQFSNHALLRLSSKLLDEIQGMQILPTSLSRYLQLDPGSQP